MKAKVAEYLALYQKLESETNTLVERNKVAEDNADEAAKTSVAEAKKANTVATNQDALRVGLLAAAAAERKAMVKATTDFVTGENEVTAAADGESARLEQETKEHRAAEASEKAA